MTDDVQLDPLPAGGDVRPQTFYACAPSPEAVGLIDATLSGAHRYYNTLVALERRRRVAVLWAQHLVSPELDSQRAEVARLEAASDKIRAEIKGRRRADRKGSKATVDEQGELRRLAAALKEQRLALREAEKAVRQSDQIKASLALIKELHNQATRAARAACGIYWGSYLGVEAAVEAACKAPYRPRPGKPPIPHHLRPAFSRWPEDGQPPDGKIGVQLQGGLLLSEALACQDTRLQIQLVDRTAWLAAQGRRVSDRAQAASPTGQQARRGRQFAIVRLRQGSDGRAPVWIEVPVMFHRALPPGETRIQWAYLQRERLPHARRGSPYLWRFQMVFRGLPKVQPKGPQAGRVAINLGWRQTPRGLRCAYFVGDDGEKGELILPTSIGARLDKANELRSLRDEKLTLILSLLKGGLSALSSLPPHLARVLPFLDRWRSQDRLIRLCDTWAGARFDGDESLFAAAVAWRRQDRHLLAWEKGAREGALACRRDLYRAFAAKLARRYEVLLYEQYALTAEKPLPEEGTQGEDRALREQQRRAAPSELRAALADSGAPRRHPDCPCATQRCSACGELDRWDAADAVEHTCGRCGARWDQDENNCRNQLAADRGREQGDDAAAVPVGGKPAGSRRFGGARKGPRKSTEYAGS